MGREVSRRLRVVDQMAIKFHRAGELYNTPSRRGRPGRRGVFNVGKSKFYKHIKPRLEKALLGERAVAYTDRSVERVQTEMIAAAAAHAPTEAR